MREATIADELARRSASFALRLPATLTISFESASIAVHVHTLPTVNGDDSRISLEMFLSFP